MNMKHLLPVATPSAKRGRISTLAGLFAGALLIAALCTGCGSSGEPASQMTSYTNNETSSETASLFTVPQDQMAHIQVVPVQKINLPRTTASRPRRCSRPSADPYTISLSRPVKM